MCGIAGIFADASGAAVTTEVLTALRDAQRHRGPDDAGLWISGDARVGLAHRRLSIIDVSSGGHQPMATADGKLRVVYNGEIYNHEALRAELVARGCHFASTSDTEVLLHGYREWGLGLLDRIRGMFAFALHDAERRELLLARDPLGIKPLYYADAGKRLVFASELRALRQVAELGDVDPEGLATFLLWGSIASPHTLFQGARALPPGSWLRVSEDGRRQQHRYYELEAQFPAPQTPRAMDAEEASERVRSALRDSVRHHLVADVPVGAFLSGGVDSSALVGLLAEAHDGPLETVTLAFDVPQLDEGALAARAARLYGTQHHEIRLRVEEVRERIPDAIAALDQPTIDGVNTYFVSEAAARAGLKVAVSGVGGDELFGGYESFHRIPQVRALHRRLGVLPGASALASAGGGALERLALPRRAAKLVRALRHGSDAYGAYFAERGLFSPPEVRALLHPDLHEAVDRCGPAAWLRGRLDLERIDAGDRISALELRQYLQVQLLRDTDAASMAHSLEVRTPLVDRELLRALAEVPAHQRQAGPAKRLLREAPKPPVPADLWDRRKQGFTLPFEHWLRSGAIETSLPEHPALDAAAMQRVVQRFRKGGLHWSRPWALTVLHRFLA